MVYQPTLILYCAAIDGLQFELKDDRDTQQYIVQVKAWSCSLVFIDCMEAWVRGQSLSKWREGAG